MKEIVSSITTRGQVTIPGEVRRKLGLGAPDKVTFVIDDDGVTLKPAMQTLSSIFGSIPALVGRAADDDELLIAEAMEDESERVMCELDTP